MRQRGFTLIELVITVAIIGLLASAAMPVLQLVAQRAKENELHQALRELRTGIDAYKAAAYEGHIQLEVGASGYPPNLQVLVDGVEDQASVDKNKIYFMRRIPRDPFYPDAAADAVDTWGLRSYKSPPDNPQPGDDVFDVYSLSQGKSISGVPYHDW